MIFDQPLIAGTLIKRFKRFMAEIKLESGETILAHCPNSGSMKGVNVPGRPVLVSYHPDPKRHLVYTWEMIDLDGGWVGINTMIPNRIAAEALEAGLIPAFRKYSEYRSEVKISEHSRIDFTLGKSGQCWVEVKNVTLVENGHARFPDSVTERGTKHLNHLIEHVQDGGKSAVLFVIQHHAAKTVGPADDLDPVFGKTLRKAAEAGVRIEAWKATVSPKEISLNEPLRVIL